MLAIYFQLGQHHTFPHAQGHVNDLDFFKKYTQCYSNDKNAKKLDKIMRLGFDGF